LRPQNSTTGSAPSHSLLDGNDSAGVDWDSLLENIGAELTQAAYPVMLQHGAVDNWIELELELWNTLTKIVAKKKQVRRHAQVAMV
jgi:hypothetical protein